ncbi:hypothetical protein COW36_12220 [bacterium (Candidatus Blackallbacteria) CG17_big_fil_post_rev_8_21_14_2_50_48_46]|uniref:DUF1641 domain-containing protein n=1 Tax=bacterium (Candidatus Blackallbacteria) CG17_big_fil_post_rev_8_21_14_2_50_48_46 TaxID=2014261 RepID=A0A2M7G3T8_9BACT|nr:MAG: hypothetical protein COW64_03040 [bacterium (Candidatus Blackallbacteria) CG18_big_fil_WC_8_21_14_2_50_49_26]PIW16525.1 MAG: hypothetical protein COW36_12220 [bacterium (Candidatus Blackallbacteria) CG17_big_fil_post_rev_8_21_14_2_50_48_46]PIW46033.1 MAG: hypothetical protein COW20_17485 [bacterium (Candidatus Blackallbacteria) CG13_big_fil_rev_8_21_14_2_50_49_14]
MSPPELTSEAIVSRLDQILARLDQLESRLEKSEKALQEIPGMAATAVNTLDELSAPLRVEGAQWPERLPSALRMLDELTEPEVLETLEHLVHKKDQFLPWLNILGDMPGMMSTAVDSLDAEAASLKASGTDLSNRLEPVLKLMLEISRPENIQTLEALSRFLPILGRPDMLEAFEVLAHHADQFVPLIKILGDIPGMIGTGVDTLDDLYKSYMAGHDLDRLIASLRHGLLDIHTVSVVASAGEALARSEQEYQPASILQMVKALMEPEFRSSMGFLLSFVRHFSHSLQASSLPHSKN